MNKFLPSATASVNGILVGANIVATRLVIDQTGPASLALLRYFIGFCCLVPPALLATRARFERRDLVPVALLGITQFGIVVTLLNYAVQYIPSARAALIFATLPLLTMVIAAVLGSEQMTWPKSTGVLLTIVGVGLALGEKALQPGGSSSSWVGELAVLASAFSGALCSVLYRPYLRKYPTAPLSALAMLASVVFLAFFSVPEGFFNAPPHFTGGGWLAVGFVGISSGVGYYLWLWSLNHASPTRVTVFLALSPITATVLGGLMLGEVISPIFIGGLICVALGLVLALTNPSQLSFRRALPGGVRSK